MKSGSPDLGFSFAKASIRYRDAMGAIRERVLANASEVKALTARFKVADIRLFGSVARDEDQESSDVGFLVEFQQGASILDQVHLDIQLSQLLECPVDVVPLGGLKPRDAHLIEGAVSF